MVHKIVLSIIIITEELEYIPTLQILMIYKNFAADKYSIMKETLKSVTWGSEV